MKPQKATFRPTLIPTLFTIPALILLLSLGTWQVYRLQWKNALIKEIEHKISMAPMALPSNMTDLAQLTYRKVHVKGTFYHEKEMYLYAGAREFKGEAGYRIFTPLQKEDGKFVLIDRGWVPVQKKLPSRRPESWVEGIQEIEGIILPGEKKKNFTPNNQLESNIWFWIDLEAMRLYTQLPELPLFYIMQGMDEKGDETKLPIGQKFNVEIQNNHLQYAIIWYSAAISLIVIYILYHRRVPS